jgi:hypothetical protein
MSSGGGGGLVAHGACRRRRLLLSGEKRREKIFQEDTDPVLVVGADHPVVSFLLVLF